MAPTKKLPAKKKSAAKKNTAPKKAAVKSKAKKIIPTAIASPVPLPLPATGSATAPPFEVNGTNAQALFTLKVYRGEGMCLLAMNWKTAIPPLNFVGFAIEYKEPNGSAFFPLKNRLSFLENDGNVNPNILSTRLSPIQKWRWVHFPFHPDLPGLFTYRVTPVFMGTDGSLSYGEFQQVQIVLSAQTYPGVMNIAFTRGFIASQAFVDRWGTGGGVDTIFPQDATQGLSFVPTDPKAAEAQAWMGFEARQALLDALDLALADPTAQVRVTAYDFNVPDILERLEQLGNRLKIILDDSSPHGDAGSAENAAEKRLVVSAGRANVQRQHVGGLQHNKTIAIKGTTSLAIGGSTNMSWRGLYVQNNNAVVCYGARAAQLWFDQFDNLFNNPNSPGGFASTTSAGWNDLQLPGINASVAFSPHNAGNAVLDTIAQDIQSTSSSLFYSLAFLYQTPGKILTAIENITGMNNRFVYGLSDKSVGGLDIQKPDGNPPIAFPTFLLTNLPEPFHTEAAGGGGVRMHHKFVVIDFDKPTARVYMGSYNFSVAADTKNGENLFVFRDRRIAVSYMIQAVTMFDHYEWRDALRKATTPTKKLYLKKPPAAAGDITWWQEDYSNAAKMRDRLLFAGT